ncbi:MAG TPA: YicC/YloC family endoribonuclease [Haliangiales bacterium]|nr:YicC/YloC family endoribonuclease [Haliangiales bacterium]
MTGHGRGTAETDDRRVTVEVRAVNHRFLDLKLRVPLDAEVERRAAEAVRRRVERGAVTVTVREEGPGTRAVRLDLPLARGVHAALAELGRELGLDGEIPVSLVAAQPGVLALGEPAEGDALFLAALDAALEAMVAMRLAEGEALARDLGARIDRLEALARDINRLAAGAPPALAARLRERLDRLGVDVPPERLAAEAALLADRADVTEELVRLASHLKQARDLVASEAPSGRKLDFLVQEMGREVNTVGSKSPSADISRCVVDAKAELEKIREQVQNVE